MNTVNLTFGKTPASYKEPEPFGLIGGSKLAEQKAQRLGAANDSVQINDKEAMVKMGIPVEGKDFIKDAQGNAHFPNKGFSIDDVTMSLQVEARNKAELREQMLVKAVSELPLIKAVRKIVAKFKI